jgi:hypothetical protein
MRTLILLALVTFAASGCSYFRAQERLDLAPFAERTVSLAADIEFAIVQSSSAHYLREYRSDPTVEGHGDKWDKIRTLLRAVVAYSIEISTLGASQLDGPERSERFATFLDRLLRDSLQDPPAAVRFTIADLDAMLLDIRQQHDFLDALRAAQPFIDELARLADLLFDATQDELDFVAEYLHERIGEDNAGPIMAWEALGEAQLRIFTSMGNLRQYRFTPSEELLETIYASEPELRDYPADPENPTSPELTQMNMTLVEKLQIGVDLKDLITPDLELYGNQRRELDDLYKNAQIQLKKARVTIIIWARAHRNLSEGVTDPAKIDIFDLTKKAVDTAL